VKAKFSLIVILAFTLFSCGKDELVFIPGQDYTIDQTLLLKQIAEAPKKYKISITNERVYFTAPNGIYIEIPSQALKNEAGQYVTGEVVMTFDDMELQKSQLLYAPSTIYNGKMFESKKMLYLDFSQDGKPLTISSPIEVIIPSDDIVTTLVLLDGIANDNESSMWIRRSAESNPLSAQSYQVGSTENQTTILGYKIFFPSNTKWVAIANTDEPLNSKTVSVCISLDQGLNYKNTVVYFISDAGRSTFRLDNVGKNDWNICTSSLMYNELCRGTFVVISDLGNENYHFGMTNAVLETDETIVIKSESKTNKEIKEILASL
jgi:hypothetical protein